MDPNGNRAKPDQASKEPSRKKRYSSIEKGKGKMVASDCYGTPDFSQPVVVPFPEEALASEQCHRPPLADPDFALRMREPTPRKNMSLQNVNSLLNESNIINHDVEPSNRIHLLQAVSTDDSGLNIPAVVEVLENMNLLRECRKLITWAGDIRETWSVTGCTIILDGWVNEATGKTYLNVLVHNPSGIVYLYSNDVTFSVGDVQFMTMMVEKAINMVRPENVLQIISYATSPCLAAVGEQIKSVHKSMFWCVSASYCLAMMLEKVASSLSWVRDTIEKAKRITRLVHKSSSIMEKFHYIVKPAKVKEATPFLTLDNLWSRRYDLKAAFSSPDWKNTSLGSSLDGRSVSKLVANKLFWKQVRLVVKAGMPIVNLIVFINTAKTNGKMPLMGFLYEKMDQMKEDISKNMSKEKSVDVWRVIDEIWNSILHSPVHAAGYYLNPSLFYSKNFSADSEVMNGLITTVNMFGGDEQTRTKIIQQLQLYRHKQGHFEQGVGQRNEYSPAEWWNQFGMHYPELQRFAKKVLGLPCNGASWYGFERDLAEKLHSLYGVSPLSDKLTIHCFASYNSLLKKLRQPEGIEFSMEDTGNLPIDDWIAGE